MTSILKSHPLLKIMSGALCYLPSPLNLNSLWNFGSLLGICLVVQILTGLFISMHYCNSVELAFSSVSHLMRDVNYGWILRLVHANGASFFFFCLYLHVGRGLYYMSYYFFYTWMIGVVMMLVFMATAFLGYVLPWGQMSFWGATVITNLFSAIPMIGDELVVWMWGGFSVGGPTLSRFYSLHFLLPFVGAGLSMVHLLFLHQTGSSNPLGLNSNMDKISFHPYYVYKDIIGMLFFFLMLFLVSLFFPWDLGDPENFIPANPLVTPIHIQPEWYFLMAYAILRSIPNKLGGVLALAFSILILMVCPLLQKSKFRGQQFYPLGKFLFWAHIHVWLLLTWLGARPVEVPYIFIGQVLSCIYFFYYFFSPMMNSFWDKLLN